MFRHPSRGRSVTRLLILALGVALLGTTLASSPAQAQPRPMIEVRVCKTAETDVPAQAAFTFTINDNVTTQRRTIRAGECASVMVWDGQIIVQEEVPSGYAVTSITADRDWPVVDRNLRLARARFFAFGDEGRLWTITFHNARLATATPDDAQPPPPIFLPPIALPPLPPIVAPPIGAPPNHVPPPAAFNWGIHANGWHVCIRNRTDGTLEAARSYPTSNIAAMPQTVGPQRDDCTLRGQPSIYGGPANINFAYQVSDYSFPLNVRLVSWHPRGTSPRFDFTCDYHASVDDLQKTCTVVRGTMQEPIFVILEYAD